MAGILSRFGDIISANINALIDKCEDPAKMIDEYLRKASEDLADVKAETAAVMAEENRCKRALDDVKAEVEKCLNIAKKALAAGNEGDAKTALESKQKAESGLAIAQKNFDAATANAQKMREMHDKLVNDINELKARRNNIKATVAVAKTQDRLNKAESSFSGVESAIAGFERMEEKAMRMLDESEAMANLNKAPENPMDSLETKYGSASATSVDDELAKLKAEMGL